MSKEAIIFSIDAGSSMEQKFIDSDSTRLKIALNCLQLTLQQKLFNNANHQIGLAFFGQNQADETDGNNTLLQPIKKPDLTFVRKILELGDVNLDNQKTGGDIFSALDFTISRLIDHCGTKKYNKRVFLFTNGRGQTNFGQRNFKRMVNELKENDIKLNIIPMDFMETYDWESNQLDDQIFADPVQARNSQLLIRLRESCLSNIQIFPASFAIDLYKKFRKRDTNPVSLYKGKLQIAPGVSIQVSTFKAIRKQKLKTLSKFDLTAPFNPELQKQKQIDIDINYIIEGDNDGGIIDKQNVMNAYTYGSNMVPMNQMFENKTKIFEEKNLTLLGFVESEKVPRHCFLGEVDIVVPNKDDQIGKKLFSAFIYSMILQRKYAIARYVPRNAKRGVVPRMVVLIPHRGPERQMFYLTQLPTIQGIRQYPFNQLKKSTQQQKQIVSQLVDKMMLVKNDNGKQVQDVSIENMFNPFRQYFYQTIFYRALNSDQQNAVPELDKVTRNYITPEAKTYPAAEPEIQQIKKNFKLKINEINKIKQKEKKVIIWKDIIGGELNENTEIQLAEQNVQEVGKKFTFDNEDNDKFNSYEPILSFRKMITNNKKDLVSDALIALSSYIQKSNKNSDTHEQNQHLVDCAKQIRIACIEQKEVEFWDDWFEKCKLNLSSNLYHMMKISGLGFISKSNQQVFKPDIYEMKPASMEVDQLD